MVVAILAVEHKFSSFCILNTNPSVRYYGFIMQQVQSKIRLHIRAVWTCFALSAALSLISVDETLDIFGHFNYSKTE